ncbi:hypothetical protein BD414DRAFT_473943 [Trametes punicea]|nr:hypothetical protein BD414DRAFT_473943 [Trametes punicea]
MSPELTSLGIYSKRAATTCNAATSLPSYMAYISAAGGDRTRIVEKSRFSAITSCKDRRQRNTSMFRRVRA